MSVSVELTDDIDVGRGDMLCRPNNQPRQSNEFDAMVCWMTEQRPLNVGDIIRVKHTTRWTRARVESVKYRIDVNTLHRDADADTLGLNEIGRVSMTTLDPLFLRLIPPQPGHRIADPCGRSHQRHGRRGDRHRHGGVVDRCGHTSLVAAHFRPRSRCCTGGAMIVRDSLRRTR